MDVKSACYTLGFNGGGNWETVSQSSYWTESEIPFLRDDMNCGSTTSDFLTCGYDAENCSHRENVLLICGDSSKFLCSKKLSPKFSTLNSHFELNFSPLQFFEVNFS